MSPSAGDFETRFRAHVHARGRLGDGGTVVVAVSGGMDSVCLLHLLRFAVDVPIRVIAAHVDHAMREDSAADADWLRDLAASWGVPFRTTRLDPAPRTESEARRLRYEFLDEVRVSECAAVVVTAHHADDQAETVLFRVLRGTGIPGLRGIRERRSPSLWRPFLPFSREDIAAYAEGAGIAWREDPTNALPYARNVIRNDVLPRVEGTVARSARSALFRLARRARENEAGWRSLLPGLLDGIDVREESDGFSVDRERLRGHHRAVQARLIRALSQRLGVAPGDAATHAAVRFASTGASGGSVDLGGGIVMRRALDRLVVEAEHVVAEDGEEDRRVEIPDGRQGEEGGEEGGEGRGERSGEREGVFGGARYRVRWGPTAIDPDDGQRQRSEVFAPSALRYPLTVRGWAPGDRVRMPYGEKKLKKMFLEARVPEPRRRCVPVVCDADGVILWVPGVVRAEVAKPDQDEPALHIRVDDAAHG